MIGREVVARWHCGAVRLGVDDDDDGTRMLDDGCFAPWHIDAESSGPEGVVYELVHRPEQHARPLRAWATVIASAYRLHDTRAEAVAAVYAGHDTRDGWSRGIGGPPWPCWDEGTHVGYPWHDATDGTCGRCGHAEPGYGRPAPARKAARKVRQ